METEAVCDANDKDKTYLDNTHPMQPDARDCSPSEITLQPQTDDVAMASQIAASPSTENQFPFLDLPPEIRIMVYREPGTYQTAQASPSWLDPKVLYFPDLRQAPITRVNKQMRRETLPLFYGSHRFAIQLPQILHGCDDIGEDNLQSVREMLSAFTPIQNNTIQASSLSFLSQLTCRLEIQSSLSGLSVEMGLTMSDQDLDCNDKGEELVQTAGLNWNRSVDVKEAYDMAMFSSAIACVVDDVLDLEIICRCQLDKALTQLAALMFYISRECPQLRRNVLVFVKPDEAFYEDSEQSSEMELLQYESE